MTKEEAKKIIEYTFLNADGHLKPLDFDYGGGKGIVEALRMAIEALSQPSLPSNLDEAAEKNFETMEVLEHENIFEETHRKIFKAGAEWMAGQGWHDITETPSIFGFYLVIHEKGWCVANYMGKGVVCESGWVEALHNIEIEHPQKWLDLRDLIPKKQ